MAPMKTVLVVDDDEDIREVISFALNEEGYRTMCAENGKVALDLLTALKPSEYPDLIIVDNLMPEMDGVAFIHALKERFPETLGRIPIALSSALGSLDPSLDKFKELQILYKPMDLDHMLSVVEQSSYPTR